MGNENDNPELMKVSQVAKLLNVTNMTVYRLVNNGELPKVVITPDCIRIKRESVLRYIQDRTTAGVHHGE